MTTEQNVGLTDEEMKFFETGDVSVLQVGLGDDDPPESLPEVQEPDPPAALIEEPELSAAEIALENERQRRMDLERRLQELESKKVEPQEEPLPDELRDPLGHMIERMKRMDADAAQLRRELAEAKQQAELRQQYEEFTSNVRSMKDEFAKQHADFDAAYNHLRSIKLADLTDAGVSKADAQRRLNQEELQLAASALERGKNPAEVIYNMASRYGYKAQEVKNSAVAQKDGQNAAEEKVTRLKNGQFASRAPQRAAPPANKELSLEGLKDASDRDLNNLVMNDDLWAQTVGGKAGGDIFYKNKH